MVMRPWLTPPRRRADTDYTLVYMEGRSAQIFVEMSLLGMLWYRVIISYSEHSWVLSAAEIVQVFIEPRHNPF